MIKQFIFLLCSVTSLGSFCQELPKITELINNQMMSDKIAAIAVGIVDNGEIVHLSATGFRDLAAGLKADINTPFHIASVSKTVTNLAIFKLVEDGLLDLDIDVNKYLPFEIRNPYFPKDKITVGQLLNHRSGIIDDPMIYSSYWHDPKGDPKYELEDFLKDYLTENGELFKKEHFEKDVNHHSFNYSNTGYSLLGLIVERISGMSFDSYCQQKLFKPLEIYNTGWFLRSFKIDEVAKTYVYDTKKGLKFRGHNGYPDYPAGQLRTSVSDFSKLVKGYLNADDSKFILNTETIKIITPDPRFNHQGFYTYYPTAMSNNLYYEHKGSDIGVRSIVLMNVQQKNALIVFLNSDFAPEELLFNIEHEVWGIK